MKKKLFFLLPLTLLAAGIAKGQYHRTFFQYSDLQVAEVFGYSNEIYNMNNKKVAWETPSFIPQLTYNVNVYNVNIPIDCGLTFSTRQNFANNYKDMNVRDTITINRFFQLSSGVYIRYKFGDYKVSTDPYFVLYAEARYNANFLGRRMDAPYKDPSFDIYNNELNLKNGIQNEFVKQFGPKYNKTSDLTINKGGPQVAFGAGYQWSSDGDGFAFILMATYSLYHLYNENYTLPNHTQPFANWNDAILVFEPKLFYRFRVTHKKESE